MKQTIFTFLLLSVLSFTSCKKDKVYPNIKQIDQQQILNYISAHNLTGFVRDTVGGDTTGIYYKIIAPGSGPALTYSTQIAMVYTVQTFDGTYTSGDTISNHYYDYLGHVYLAHLPLGLQTAIINDLKNNGGRMRVLIPSHLSYGLAGTGSGSSQVANNRIAGNECLDYYVNLVNNFPVYDDMVIQNYMKDSSLTGYTKVQSQLYPGNYYYYKILTPGTGTDYITINSTVTTTYTGQLFDANQFGQYNVAGGTAENIADLVPGVQEGLERFALMNTKISLLLPSTLGYGFTPPSTVLPFSCLRFTFIIDAVTP